MSLLWVADRFRSVELAREFLNLDADFEIYCNRHNM
jgi:hypothetical protein